MTKGRLEAFSDGVFAIIITIMVLELKVPHSPEFHDLLALTPKFLSYLLSYLYLGIYWNNHHHLLQAIHHINGKTLWANLHLLFWLSLTPFVTAWAGENHFAAVPVAAYGFVLLMSGVAYLILTRVLVSHHGTHSLLQRAIGKDLKGKISLALYSLSIPIACSLPFLSVGIYILVAVIWFIPDTRIERMIENQKSET